MAQLSRPYQIALAALALVVLLAAVLAFGRHSSPSSSSAGGQAPGTSAPVQPAGGTAAQSSSSGSTGQASAAEQAAAKPSSIYHGALPGVEGLTRAIDKAHGAVATSQKYDGALEQKSAQASSAGASSSATAPTTNVSGAASASSTSSAHSGSRSASTTVTHSTTAAGKHTTTIKHTHSSSGAHSPSSTTLTANPPAQRAVESTVAHGKAALLLFWNRGAANDAAVHTQVRIVAQSDLPVVVYEGSDQQVAQFGAITRSVQIYGTPTILIVGHRGATMTLTGFQDAFAIEQAVREALSAHA